MPVLPDLSSLLPFLDQLPSDVRNLLVRLLVAVLALLLIWMLRRVLAWIIIRPLRSFARRTPNVFDEKLLDAAMMPARLALIALGLLVAGAILEVNSPLLLRVVRTLFILALLLLVNQLIDILASSALRLFAITGIRVQEKLMPFVRVTGRLFVIVTGVVIVLQEWGYDVSGVVAGFGLGGLAFSLAAQDTVANLFGFIAIVGDRPLDVGDYIKTPDVEGLVEHVGLRSTRVRQLDQAVVYVPNSKLAGSAILNWSRLAKRRIDFILTIKYSASSDEMRTLLERLRSMLKAQETVEPESVIVNFINFGDSSLEVLVRAYVKIADWGEFTTEKERLHLIVLDIVHELGLEIAFPSQSLYVEHLPDTLLDLAHGQRSSLRLTDSAAMPEAPASPRTHPATDDVQPNMPHGDEPD